MIGGQGRAAMLVFGLIYAPAVSLGWHHPESPLYDLADNGVRDVVAELKLGCKT